MSSNKVLENLTKNQYVGVGLAAVVVAVAAYFLLKKIGSDTTTALGKAAKWVGDNTGIVAAGDAISQASAAIIDSQPDSGMDTWASWYDPTTRSVFFYYLTFPDGNSHFVGGSSVATDATFIYSDGNTYRIGNSKLGDLRAYPWTGVSIADPGATGW